MDKTNQIKALKLELNEKERKLKIAEMDKFGLGKMQTLIENNLDQAKLLIATQDVIEKLQKIASRLAEINADEIMPLADAMKAAFGPEVAQDFEHVASQSILAAQDSVRAAKDAIDNAVLKVEGKMVSTNDSDMSKYEEPVEPTQVEPQKTDTILGSEKPENEPPLGREVRDSIEYKKPVLKESNSKNIRKARAIASIIETNIKSTGSANTSKILEVFLGKDLTEENNQNILSVFFEEYGCSPAIYSAKIKKMMAEDIVTTGDKADQPMNRESQLKNQAIAAISSKVASNPGVLNQPVSSVTGSLDAEQKNAINNEITSSGINPSTTVKDFLQNQTNGNNT